MLYYNIFIRLNCCMKKLKAGINKILTILFIVLLSVAVFGQKKQNPNKKPFKERISIGGSLGLSFGSNSFLVEVSPMIGYAITKKFIVGIGLSYKFYKYKDYYALTYTDSTGAIYISDLYDLKTNMYGGSVWARYFLTGIGVPVIENLFLHAEVEPLLFINNFTYNPSGIYYDPYGNRYSKNQEQISLTGIFLGGGIQQPIGGRSYMYLEILWNFNEELYSPYSNPRIRIGVAVGL